MQRDESQKFAFPEPDRTNLLGQTQRIKRLATRAHVPDLFPFETRRSIEIVPARSPQAPEDIDNLHQQGAFEREELRLKFRAVQVGGGGVLGQRKTGIELSDF